MECFDNFVKGVQLLKNVHKFIISVKVESLKCALSVAALARTWRSEGVTDDNRFCPFHIYFSTK